MKRNRWLGVLLIAFATVNVCSAQTKLDIESVVNEGLIETHSIKGISWMKDQLTTC